MYGVYDELMWVYSYKLVFDFLIISNKLVLCFL